MTMTESPLARTRRAARGGLRAISSSAVGRYVLNIGPVVRHRRNPTPLPPSAERVARTLASDGVCLTTAAELLGDGELLAAVQQRTRALRSRPDLERDPAKPFLTELLGAEPQLSPADPLVRLALHPSIRGVAERYSGMELRVQDVNVWVNAPSGSGPTQSQRWHRDLPEDCDIVKCFVYLSDVPPGAGPLQYVTGSNTRRGRRARLQAEFDGIGYRLDEAEIVSVFGAERIVTAEGPAGTLVFADTRGIHRGGHARDAERVVAQITYGSRASTRPRNLRAAPGVDRAELRDFRLAS